MVKDSLESSHSINVEVNDPSEINSLFDDITYNKVNSTKSVLFILFILFYFTFDSFYFSEGFKLSQNDELFSYNKFF